MNKSKKQGTDWETEFVNRARDHGLFCDRLAEGGGKDKGDVWLVNPPGDTANTHVALAWKRLTGDGRHRTPDGVRDGVFVRTEDFLWLVMQASIVNNDIGWVVECKAREVLNVTRALEGARRKAL